MDTNTNPDEFCGFANRETYMVNLHLMNDRFMYGLACSSVASLAARGIHPRAIGERLVELIRSVTESGDKQALTILRDCGSLWRVDELQLGTVWLDSVSEMEEFAL